MAGDQPNNHQPVQSCYENWVTQQHLDLNEMLQTLDHNPMNDNLRLLIQKNIDHFQEYLDNRSAGAQHDAPSVCSPSWGTTFERSYLWIGGCRPSLTIRFVYSLCGCELEECLTELLQGERHENLGELSAQQLKLIDVLHAKTIKEEEHLSSRMAILQEDIADGTLVKIARKCKEVGEASEGVVEALEGHALGLADLVRDADKLRLSTLKEMMVEILTPFQAVDLLVALKKLHLSIHEWCKRRDQQMEITSSTFI